MSKTIRVMSGLNLQAWMKWAIPSEYVSPSPAKAITFKFGFPSFIPIARGIARPCKP